MAYQLTISEMLEALRVAGAPKEARRFEKAIEAISTAMAETLADKVGIDCGDVTDGCGMFAAPFYPAHEGQPLPDALEGFDNSEEWSE
jgi:hypothetical protein